MVPPRPPLPDDGIYRMILMVLVGSVMVGAVIALAGELVYHNEALSHAGAWIAIVSGGIYFVFRLLGRREAERRARLDQQDRDREGPDP